MKNKSFIQRFYNMGDVKVCRICLNKNVKMFNLQSEPLKTCFSSIMINSKPLNTTNLPPYACFECAALVKKFYLFREKCIESQTVLCGLLDESGKLKLQQIKASDRESLLVITKHPQISVKDEKNSGNEPEYYIIQVGIKKEDDDEVPNGPDGDVSSDDECEKFEKKREKIEIDVELGPTQEKCKQSPSKKPLVPKVKEQGKTTTIKRAVGKRKPRNVAKKENVGEDDEIDMQDITVISLTLEEQHEEMNKRKQSSNYLTCPYQCHLCYKGFNNELSWKLHATKHSPIAGDIECDICKFRFKTRRSLLRHALNHGKKFVCKLCPYNSYNVTTLKWHLGSHKGVTHKCKYCDEVFAVKTTLLSHLRMKHPSENICGYCGYAFVSKQGLLVHRNIMHKDIVKSDENEEGHYCKECDVKFISTEAYKRHMIMSVKHVGSMDCIKGCRVCGMTFVSPEELKVHHRKEHPRKQPQQYHAKPAITNWPSKCTHCTEVLPNSRAYWQHFCLSHPDENYPVEAKHVCDVCGKSFRGNAFLTYHKDTHRSERAYKCATCGKAFFNRVNLRIHVKTHSDDRRFPCSVCFKAFKDKGALDRHLRIHTGQKPYECEVCGKGFSQSNSRKMHVRTVHLKQPSPYLSRARSERRRKLPPKDEADHFMY